MIELKNINISFESKKVFENAMFRASPGYLTVICGKSGMGKSTLINTLLFLNKCDYYYNELLINEDDKDDFIYDNIGIVHQTPCFFEDLKVKDHISFILEQFELKEYDEKLLDIFHLKHLLDKYPKQLSGGEKSRVALLLSLVKKPKILILDEPTSSLDKVNKAIVINYLKEYALIGNIVIVTTHEKSLINSADHLYEIKDKRLVLKESINIDNESYINNLCKKKNKNHFLKYIVKSRKHKNIYQKSLTCLISCSIALLSISFFLNNSFLDYSKEELNKISTDEIIVHKNPFLDKNYLYNGGGVVMNQTDLTILGSIPGVKSVEWRYDMMISNDNDIYLSTSFSNSYDKTKITAYENNKKVKLEDVSNIGDVYLHTYIDNKNYENCLIKEFSEDNSSIYLTEELYNIFFDSQGNQLKELEFEISVPIYNSSGISTVVSDIDENLTAPGNYTTCEYKKVRLPVRGIIKGNSLGAESTNNAIYLSQNQLLDFYYQSEQEYPDERIIYWLAKTNQYYINKIPNNLKINSDDQVVTQTKWTTVNCNAYTIVLEDISLLESVTQDLKDKGYNVENKYFNIQLSIDLLNNNREIYITMSLIIVIVLLLFYMYQCYINQFIQNQAYVFLSTLGLNRKLKRHYFFMNYLYNSLLTFIYSFIFFFVIRFILEGNNIAMIKPTISIFFLLFSLSFLIETVIPLVLKKVIKYD